MPILIVDDNSDDRELILRHFVQFKDDHPIFAVSDGKEALDFLFRRGKFANRVDQVPFFMLLDIKMPRVDGFEVLQQLRKDPKLEHMPIVIFSSSNQDTDIMRAYEHRANAYVVKPIPYNDFEHKLTCITGFWVKCNTTTARVVE
jgi:CheY-like chemotaxis protein